KDGLPRGTVSIPLERFELGASGETEAPAGTEVAETVGAGNAWLRGLYRLLREANPCETEDELFAAATRVLGEVFPGARVKVLFESGWGGAASGAKPVSKDGKRQTLVLSTWHAPGSGIHGGSQNTKILEERLTEQRNR